MNLLIMSKIDQLIQLIWRGFCVLVIVTIIFDCSEIYPSLTQLIQRHKVFSECLIFYAFF